jgi:hypothetical protein
MSVFLEDVLFCLKDVLKEKSRPSADEAFPELSKKKNRHASGCGPMVIAEHSAEALSALNRMMG